MYVPAALCSSPSPLRLTVRGRYNSQVLNSRPDFALYNHRGHAFAELRKRFGAEGAGATR